jgi:hypothetical protein
MGRRARSDAPYLFREIEDEDENEDEDEWGAYMSGCKARICC